MHPLSASPDQAKDFQQLAKGVIKQQGISRKNQMSIRNPKVNKRNNLNQHCILSWCNLQNLQERNQVQKFQTPKLLSQRGFILTFDT